MDQCNDMVGCFYLLKLGVLCDDGDSCIKFDKCIVGGQCVG